METHFKHIISMEHDVPKDIQEDIQEEYRDDFRKTIIFTPCGDDTLSVWLREQGYTFEDDIVILLDDENHHHYHENTEF